MLLNRADIGFLYKMLSGLLKQNNLEEKCYYCLTDSVLAISHHNHRNRSVVQPQCLKAHQPTDEVPPKHRSEGLGALLDSLASHQNGSGSASTETFFNFQLSKGFPVQEFIYFLC